MLVLDRRGSDTVVGENSLHGPETTTLAYHRGSRIGVKMGDEQREAPEQRKAPTHASTNATSHCRCLLCSPHYTFGSQGTYRRGQTEIAPVAAALICVSR